MVSGLSLGVGFRVSDARSKDLGFRVRVQGLGFGFKV